MNKIHLELTIEEINLVLAALGKLPYEVSVKLINHIVNTTKPQIDTTE